MKRLAIVALLLTLCSCQSWRSEVKSFKAQTVGIPRTITFYNCAGNKIRVWHTTAMVTSDGGDVTWIGDDGKRISVLGSVTVEED